MVTDGPRVDLIRANVLEDEVPQERIPVTDLHCGDLFIFRGVKYATLAAVFNEATPNITTVTAASYESHNVVASIVFYVHFKVIRFGRADLKLESLDMTDKEVLTAAREAGRS